MILDSEMPHSASRVSVGLINPFIGPKFNIPEEFSLCMKQNFNFLKILKKSSQTNTFRPLSYTGFFKIRSN